MFFFAVERKAHFFGEESLFALVEFLTKLRERGPTATGVARWALKVYEEILSLALPLQHPAAVAVSAKTTTGAPRLVKHAPMLDMQFVLDLEALAVDTGRPLGMRFYASAYLLMVFASLRFSDCKAFFEIWTTETAVCGRPIDLKLRTRPVITWATPIGGINSKGKWIEPLLTFWRKQLPFAGGHHSIFRQSDDHWAIDVSLRPPYYAVSKMFKKMCEHMGYANPVWALRIARAWFPTCANQLGWSEDERRRLGHWVPGPRAMDTYDRAVCTTELRVRNSNLGKITNSGWAPTPSFDVPNNQLRDVTQQSGGSEVSQPKKQSDHGATSAIVVKLGQDTPPALRAESDENSSTSSVAWDNASDVLSEVDIEDLYSGR